MKKKIYIQGIGDIKSSILLSLQKTLISRFKKFIADVKILPDPIPLELSDYNLNRRRYDSSLILRKLKKLARKESFFRVLGVIDQDIYWGNFYFAFGRARKPPNPIKKSTFVALISVTRLGEKFYRRPSNRAIFELRTSKEAIHELGHTFGLGHCKNYCVMKFSKSLVDIDRKSENFCEICNKKVEEFFSTKKKALNKFL